MSLGHFHLLGSAFITYREPKMNECASVDQAYMDGVYLHEKIFKKEKWYEWHTQMMKYETLMKTSLAV
jgi:hypothetical protein